MRTLSPLRTRERIVFLVELESCVKVEVDVLGSPFPIVRTVSVDVKQHFEEEEEERRMIRTQEVCESR